MCYQKFTLKNRLLNKEIDVSTVSTLVEMRSRQNMR